MIEIEINCNDDMINVYNGIKLHCQTKIQYPDKFIKLFEEIFTLIPEHNIDNVLGIILTKVDEDSKIVVAEW